MMFGFDDDSYEATLYYFPSAHLGINQGAKVIYRFLIQNNLDYVSLKSLPHGDSSWEAL